MPETTIHGMWSLYYTFFLTAMVTLLLMPSAPVSAYTQCANCDRSKCKDIDRCNKNYRLVMDSCNCCKRCVHVNTPDPTPADDPCKMITCKKGKVCLLNIQGIPMCRCPNIMACKMRRRKDVCASDGKTYKSRCHFRVHACNAGKIINKKHHHIIHRGSCRMKISLKKSSINKKHRSKSKRHRKSHKKRPINRWGKKHGGQRLRSKNKLLARERKRQQRQKRRRQRVVY